jgi:hypothetical protein
MSSPQPSCILRLPSPRTTNACLIREQVITEFHMSTPDRSFKFQEVPSYLALDNLSLPDYTSESDSDPTSQSSSPTSASTQHQSSVSPIAMAALSLCHPEGMVPHQNSLLMSLGNSSTTSGIALWSSTSSR